MIKNYVQRLSKSRGFSPRTCDNYKRTLKLFENYLKSAFFFSLKNCERIKLRHIDLFIQHERNLGKSIRTCNNYLAAIKCYLRWCLIQGYQVEDYRKLISAKESKRKIESLTDDECKKLMDYFRNVKPSKIAGELAKTRDLCIATLLLCSWMRVSELANLEMSDIWEAIQIIWKGGVRRVVYLLPQHLKLVQLYMYMRRKFKCKNLFISFSGNSYGKKLSTVSIENIIREWGKKVWVNVFPHKLRHTFATQLLRAKASLVHIQRLLGHANISTTQTYLTVFNDELKATQNLLPIF